MAAVVAVLCIAAFGAAATTLESSLSSAPEDLVDPDYGNLPFDREDVSELSEELRAAEEEERESETSKPAAEGSGDPQPSSGGGVEDPRSVESGASGRPDSAGEGPVERSLLERLLALLRSLWPLLILLLVGALAYRYRERLRALLAALLGGIVSPAGDSRPPESDPWADLDPSNDVERAWVSMVRAAGLSRPWTKTPAECADEAVSSGMDPEGVRTITEAYEEVRYGVGEPTDRHERLAREGLRRIGLGRRVR